MIHTKLTIRDIESRINTAYSSAQAMGWTSARLLESLKPLWEELASKTASGRARYTKSDWAYASGYSGALFHNVQRNLVEFVYRDAQGVIFSVLKGSAHRSTEEYFQSGRGSELGNLEATHVWRGTDKPFSPWSVPNRDSEAHQRRELLKKDKRYTVQKEFIGHTSGAKWVLRFCGDWLTYCETEPAAWDRAVEHNAQRI
jgi:hypothetical protein